MTYGTQAITVGLMACGVFLTARDAGLMGKTEKAATTAEVATPWQLSGPARIVVQICNG